MTPEEEEKLLRRLITLEETLFLKSEEIESCQINVYTTLKSHDEKFKAIDEHFDKQSKQRKEQNDEVMLKLNQFQVWTEKHGDEEMDKMKAHTEAIQSLTEVVIRIDEQTKNNTTYITSAKYNEELEARVASKIKEIDAPREEIIHKVKMTAIGVVTTAVLSASGYGIITLYKLSAMMGG